MYRFLVVTSAIIVASLVAVTALSYRSTQADCTIGNVSECRTLDPHLMAWVHENRVGRALYEGLTAIDPDTLRPAPGVAKRWELSADGLRYTFFLRHDARWSNGDAVTAEDFYWSWERGLNPRIGADYTEMLFHIKNGRAYFDSILAREKDASHAVLPYAEVGVRVVDPYTLVVELENPCVYFLELTAESIYRPIHRATYERVGAYHWPASPTGEPGRPYEPGQGDFTRRHLATRPGTLVSNGAYGLEDWQFKRTMMLRKNPYYWNRDTVALERIEVLPIDDRNTAFMAYETQVTDWSDKPPTLTLRRLYEAWSKGERPDFHHAASYATYFYRFNCTRPPFDDAGVRRAFTMAVDKAEICRDIAGLGETPATVFVPPAGRDASARKDAAGKLHTYEQPVGLPYDLEAARRALADAGWVLLDGRLQRNGQPFPQVEIVYNTDVGHNLIAQAIGKMWQEDFGVDVSLKNLELKVFNEVLRKQEYMVSRAGWYGDYLDPTTFLNMFRTDGGFNRTGWSNRRYDDLLDRAEAEIHPGKRFTLLKQAETILVEQELPILPIYHYVDASMFRSYVKGVTQNIRGWVFLKAMSINRGQPL